MCNVGVSDQIADRGEKLELLVDKTEDLSANVRLLSSAHLECLCSWAAYCANNMDPDQTAPKEQSDQSTFCFLS